MFTCRVLPGHVFGAGGLPLLYSQIGDVEGGHVHIIGAVLVSQGSVSLRTRQGEIIQFEFITLVAVNLIQHFL
jgi:hypothetical protein